MGWYREHLLPRIVDRALSSREAQALRQRCLSGLSGTIVEIGCGSGLNLTFYPPEVDRVLACEPSAGGRRLAKRRLETARLPVELMEWRAEELPLEDGSVDGVVTTWTLCTLPDVQGAMSQLRRVLRPGGRLHFLEHGRAADEALAKWQDRLTPLQKLIGGGCHLNRRIDEIIREGGLEMRRLENFFMKGPRVGTYMYSGIAVKPSEGKRAWAP